MPELEKKRKTESRMMTEGCFILIGFTIVGIIALYFVIRAYNNW